VLGEIEIAHALSNATRHFRGGFGMGVAARIIVGDDDDVSAT
jgi:hypothetical protein